MLDISEETLVTIGKITSSLFIVGLVAISAIIVVIFGAFVLMAIEDFIAIRELNKKILNRYKAAGNPMLIQAYQMNCLKMKKAMFNQFY